MTIASINLRFIVCQVLLSCESVYSNTPPPPPTYWPSSLLTSYFITILTFLIVVAFSHFQLSTLLIFKNSCGTRIKVKCQIRTEQNVIYREFKFEIHVESRYVKDKSEQN